MSWSKPLNPPLTADFRHNDCVYEVKVTMTHGSAGAVQNTIVLPDGSERRVDNAFLIFQDGGTWNRRFRRVDIAGRVTYHPYRPELSEGDRLYKWGRDAEGVLSWCPESHTPTEGGTPAS